MTMVNLKKKVLQLAKDLKLSKPEASAKSALASYGTATLRGKVVK